MIFEPINAPNMFGYEVYKGDRSAQVVRCYQGEWTTFCYFKGKIICLHQRTPDVAFQVSKAEARAFVLTGQLPTGVLFDESEYHVNGSNVWVRNSQSTLWMNRS